MTTEEFNKCVDLHADSLYRFILKNIKDKDKSKDIVQDTYEKLWLKRDEINTEKAKSYMFTTAYRTMIDKIRRDKKQEPLEDFHHFSRTYSQESSDLKKVLNEALDKLNEIQRSVILLRDYEGYSYDEIGQITGLSEAQVKVYIFRARVTLKEYIGSIESVI